LFSHGKTFIFQHFLRELEFMALKTRLGQILKPLNQDYGRVAPNWGTTPIMAIFMGLFLTFLLTIIQKYNGTILI